MADDDWSWEVSIEGTQYYLTDSELQAVLHAKHVAADKGEALFGSLLVKWQKHWQQPPDRDTGRMKHAFAEVLARVNRQRI